MNSRLHSVRFQLPALLLVVGITGYTLSLALALQRTTATELESREQAARSSLSAVARMIADLDYRHAADSICETVAQLGAMSDLNAAVYVDAAGLVNAATRRDWIGAPLDSLEWPGSSERIARARLVDHSVTERDAHGFTLVAIPIRSGTLDRLGNVSNQGVLLARFDLRPLVRMVRRETLHFYGMMALASLLAIATVSIYLHSRVVRPARRIALAAKQSAAGNRGARTGLRGDDELALAGRSFDHMAENVEEAEATLRRQQGLLDGLLAAVPVGVSVVDRATRTVLYANRRVQELSGYDSPVGQPIAKAGGRRETDGGVEIPTEELPIERALAEGRNIEADNLVCVRPDGTRVPVIATAHLMNLAGGPEFDAVVAVVQDRRDIERAFAELKASEERFQNASIATGQAVYEWDMVLDRCRFSDSITSIFGYAASEVDSSAKRTRVSHPDDLPALRREMETCKRDRRVFEAVHRLRHKDGRWRWVRDRGVLHFSADGRAVRMVGAVADVTDQRELEAQLLQAQKMETVGTLAGGVAHDFNNQLTGVLGHLDLLGETLSGDDERQEHVRIARRAAERCAELTRGLLAFSRKLRSEARPMDVNVLIQETATLLRRVLPATIRLELQPDPGVSRAVVDPTQFQQVVLNLCVNARDAMPGGGVLSVATSALRITEGDVTAGRGAPGEYVCITVTDTGIGMTPEIQARIFEPFFTTKEVGAGTGLGLAMVYGIVAQHNGWVSVDSASGRGSMFRVNLPAAAASEPEAPSTARRAGPLTVRAPRLVLVVDDEPVVRQFAVHLLERAGCRVLGAADGREALEHVDREGGSIECALLDLTMPGPPIRDTLRAMREKAPGMRIVVTSGYSQEASRLQEIAGMAFLPKPYTPGQLLTMMCADPGAAPSPGLHLASPASGG